MLILLVVMLVLTSKLEIIPKTKRQAAAEWIVTFARNHGGYHDGPQI